MTVAKQIQRYSLPSASVEGIGRSNPAEVTLLPEVNKFWHGVRLHESVWGECSHSVALGAELCEEMFVHFIRNAGVGGPLRKAELTGVWIVPSQRAVLT